MACMNVLLTLGHPRKVSLCAALCAAYREGACGGANVETLVLADLAFDPYVRVESPEQQPLEPGLEIARQLIEWVDHLVFVHPTCCGYEPALLKGFLERMVMPGFAFRFDAPDSASASGCGAAGPRKSSPPWTPRRCRIAGSTCNPDTTRWRVRRSAFAGCAACVD